MKKNGPQYGIKDFSAKANRWLMLSKEQQFSINFETLRLTLNAIHMAYNRGQKITTAWVMVAVVESKLDAENFERKAREAVDYAYDQVAEMGYRVEMSLIRTSVVKRKLLLQLTVKILNVRGVSHREVTKRLFSLQSQKAARTRYPALPRLVKKK